MIRRTRYEHGTIIPGTGLQYEKILISPAVAVEVVQWLNRAINCPYIIMSCLLHNDSCLQRRSLTISGRPLFSTEATVDIENLRIVLS